MPRRKKRNPGEIVPFGRPPVDPLMKVGKSVRCLVTPPVDDRLEEIAQKMGFSKSDVLRLALYQFMKRKGELEGLENDRTWQETLFKIESSEWS